MYQKYKPKTKRCYMREASHLLEWQTGIENAWWIVVELQQQRKDCFLQLILYCKQAEKCCDTWIKVTQGAVWYSKGCYLHKTELNRLPFSKQEAGLKRQACLSLVLFFTTQSHWSISISQSDIRWLAENSRRETKTEAINILSLKTLKASTGLISLT